MQNSELAFSQIDHLGIAVRSIEAALPYYEGVLGLKCERIEVVESQKVRTAFLELGGVYFELLEPTSEDSPVAKFLSERGEGIHHIAYRTEDVSRQLARAKEAGVRVIHEKPFEGAHGKLVAFLHPKSTMGVLTEFCQLIQN